LNPVFRDVEKRPRIICLFSVSSLSDAMRDRLNLSFDSVSLDSGRRETTAEEDDIDFYGGGGGTAVAAPQKPPPPLPPLQNGGEPPVRVSTEAASSSAYSEALTPVTNKVGPQSFRNFLLPIAEKDKLTGLFQNLPCLVSVSICC
jgi:hypothetical protein